MKTINDLKPVRVQRPVKVLQFGEGNFLRAFADYFIDIANEKGVFDSNVAVVVPLAFNGVFPAFKEQDCFYTVLLRGKENGANVDSARIVSCVKEVIDSGHDHDAYMAYAKSDDLRFVISNTTEAGIVYDPTDKPDGVPATFPGKVTKFLYERYVAFGGDKEKGLIFLPVELIDRNGDNLKKCIIKMAENWGLEAGFTSWVEEANVFCNTLVDRIVTGYPKNADELCEKLGYKDNLIDVAEPFGLWVIESEKDISGEFTLKDAGLPIVFTDNLAAYRERKVRILNGAHTALTPISYLAGKNIVRDCVEDEIIGKYVNTILHNEILPSVPLSKEQVELFISQVIERFENPTLDHLLLSISLNSVSKWKARLFCSFKDYYAANGCIPKLITFSFAGLLAFYTSAKYKDGVLVCNRGEEQYTIKDDEAALKFFAEYSTKDINEYVTAACKRTDFWGEDLTAYKGFNEEVQNWLSVIRTCGAGEALKKVLE